MLKRKKTAYIPHIISSIFLGFLGLFLNGRNIFEEKTLSGFVWGCLLAFIAGAAANIMVLVPSAFILSMLFVGKKIYDDDAVIDNFEVATIISNTVIVLGVCILLHRGCSGTLTD